MTFQLLNHNIEPRKFCLLFGTNLLTSASEKMHDFWFKKYAINMTYKNYILQDSEAFIEAIECLYLNENFMGGNITMPFKQTLVQEITKGFILSSTVKNTASANTLFRDAAGKFNLENTDVIGIKKTLAYLLGVHKKIKNVIILGGGGSSASCIYSLCTDFDSTHIYCLTRNVKLTKNRFSKSNFLLKLLKNKTLKVENLNRNFLHSTSSSLQNLIESQEQILIINTLPLGATAMYAESNLYCCALLKSRVNKPTLFFDLVYQNTDACSVAKELSFSYLNGAYMLKEQARESFKLWTGILPEYKKEMKKTSSLHIACE